MDAKQMARENQAQLYNVGNTIIQGGIQKSSHGDVYAVRQNRYRDELDRQVMQKKQSQFRDKYNDWTMDNMHLNTISYAPVGNPAVSSRRSNRMETSYQSQYAAPIANAAQNELAHSQSAPVCYFDQYLEII